MAVLLNLWVALGVAYQISYISDIYITTHNSKVTVEVARKRILWLGGGVTIT